MDMAGSVARIDPTSNEAVETVKADVLPAALAVGEAGALWLVATVDDAVVHVDPHLAGGVARTTVHRPAGISAGRMPSG